MYETGRFVRSDGKYLPFGVYSNTNSLSVIHDNSKLLVNMGDMRSYLWEYEIINNRMTNFRQKTKKFTLSCLLSAQIADRKNLSNEFFDYDIIHDTYTQIALGNLDNEIYLDCKIIGINPSEYLNKNYIRAELIVETDRPYWYKKINRNFNENETYPIIIFNGSPNIALDYKIKISGAAINPKFTFNDTEIILSGGVNVSILTSETIEIDSKSKSIIKYSTNSKTDIFNLRMTDTFFLKPIKAGNYNQIKFSAENTGNVELTLYDYYSSPNWDISFADF